MIQKKSQLQTEEISANIPAKHQDSKISVETINNIITLYLNVIIHIIQTRSPS